ncbi:MAG: N-acyl homoserine lactonase family protein [Pusillimonas sp.]
MPLQESNATPQHEVFAIRYASVLRSRNANFLGGDPHDGPMALDFFVWLIKSGDFRILVDTGFNMRTAEKRGRKLMRCPVDALSSLGVQPETIKDVVLTHLHYDHAGNLDKLPEARFHIQDDEVSFATGRCMCFDALRHSYSVDDVVTLVRSVYDDRVVFHSGDETIAPGISLLKIGGHTKGLQAVRVHTRRGWVVLASDASHYYENMDTGRPFPVVYNVADMLSGYARLEAAAQTSEHIIPGHDPLVLEKYPLLKGDCNIALLHLDPI